MSDGETAHLPEAVKVKAFYIVKKVQALQESVDAGNALIKENPMSSLPLHPQSMKAAGQTF